MINKFIEYISLCEGKLNVLCTKDYKEINS